MARIADAARALLSRPARPASGPEHEPSSDFGRWLGTVPPDRRLSACLDFLVYWFACGDARPDPEERSDLLAADPRTLQPREAGKRAAWAEDIHAFADTIHCVMDTATPDQRVQFLELVLAVRFCEGERGASENVLVRFLGDVFGLRTAELTRRYERACATPLQALPKLDRGDWWLQAPDGGGFEPATGDEARLRRRLGLGLYGPLMDVAVTDGFERRLSLVDPGRFDRLGRHERQVAGRLHTRLVAARDDLLERAA